MNEILTKKAVNFIFQQIKDRKKIERLILCSNYRYEKMLDPEETVNKINEIIDKINEQLK